MRANEVKALLEQFRHNSSATDKDDKAVLEPYTYLFENPGKDIRSTLILAFNHWIGLDDAKLAVVQDVVEKLHTASLLIDDVEDGSALRRGKPAAHLRYGLGQTINAANYVYFKAYEQLRQLHEPAVDAVFAEELLNLHRGQGLELVWRENNICPSEQAYISMVNDKTGGLLRLAIRVMLALKSSQNVIPLANAVGILFQIRDDYMNLASLSYARAKGFAEDLTEGKYSFPIAHAINQGDAERGRRIEDILRLKTTDKSPKLEALSLLAPSLEYTVEQCRMWQDVCRQEVANLGGNAMLEKILDRLEIRIGDEGGVEEVIAVYTRVHEDELQISSDV